MAWIAKDSERYLGKIVGNGHCIAFVRQAAGLPPTTHWRKGGSVFDAPSGTIIATFDEDGRYGNHTTGASHAAVLLEATGYGLRVRDQWIGRPVAERLIRFKDGKGPAADDADQYSVIEIV